MRGAQSGPLEVLVQDQTIDFASCAAATAADQAIVVANAEVGDTVLCNPLGVWLANLGLPVGRCLVAGTVQFRIVNPTAGALDPVSQSCRLTILRIRP